MTNYLTTLKQYNGTTYTPLYPETLTGDVYLDATARECLNLSTGATLSDGLVEIAQNGGVYQVGDVLITARTGLDDKWLLLNGQSYSTSTYSDLYAVLNSSSVPTYSPATGDYAYIRAKK